MEKEIIEQYIDACEVVKETEKEITRLKKKRKTIVQTNVSGSNPEFPYNPMHFKSIGTSFTYEEDSRLRREEKVLEEQKKAAERIKLEVEMWMLTIPLRMQRIIRYRIFEKKSWEKVAEKLGRNATGESIKKEYQRFFEKK
ncbi:RNA polymerase subunit sigma-70 [Blautia sp. AF22-5LB]|nr:RNA polymerase subunit sigma-70 [Blautia sp. AF22-5LB]